MNLAELQAELRHFAAERDWQSFHTPKNLSTALMVEAAELAEIFQWMTAEESRVAHRDAASKERIGEELADVLLYLLQVADHSEIDIAQAVSSKLGRNGLKYPPKRSIARVSPARAVMSAAQVKAVTAARPAAKKAPAKPAAVPPAKRAAPAVAKKTPASVNADTKAAALSPDSAATIKKLADSLRKMGNKRPTKPASLRRSLKSFLGMGATEASVEVALLRLIEGGVVKVDSVTGASYPRFDVQGGTPVSQS